MKMRILSLTLALALGLSLTTGGALAGEREMQGAPEIGEQQLLGGMPVQGEAEPGVQSEPFPEAGADGGVMLEKNKTYRLEADRTVTGLLRVDGQVSLLLPAGTTLTALGGIGGVIPVPTGNQEQAENTLTILTGSGGTLTGSGETGLAMENLNLEVLGGRVTGTSAGSDAGISLKEGNLVVGAAEVSGTSQRGAGLSILGAFNLGGQIIVTGGTVTGISRGSGSGIEALKGANGIEAHENAVVTGESAEGIGIDSSRIKAWGSTVKGSSSGADGIGIRVMDADGLIYIKGGFLTGAGQAVDIRVISGIILAAGTVTAENGRIEMNGLATMDILGDKKPGTGWIRGKIYDRTTGKPLALTGQSGFFTADGRTVVSGNQDLASLAGEAENWLLPEGEELDIAGTLTVGEGKSLVNRGTVCIRDGGELKLAGTFDNQSGDLRQEMSEPAVTFQAVGGVWETGTETIVVHPCQTAKKDVFDAGKAPVFTGEGLLFASQIPTRVAPDEGLACGSWDVEPAAGEPVSEDVTYTCTLSADFAEVTRQDGTLTVSLSKGPFARGTVYAAAYLDGKLTGLLSGPAGSGGTLTTSDPGFLSADTVKVFFTGRNGAPLCPAVLASLN